MGPLGIAGGGRDRADCFIDGWIASALILFSIISPFAKKGFVDHNRLSKKLTFENLLNVSFEVFRFVRRTIAFYRLTVFID